MIFVCIATIRKIWYFYSPLLNHKIDMKPKLLVTLLALLLVFGCKKDEPEPDVELNRNIVGLWYSAGNNLSIIMSEVDGVDSAIFEFNADSTYTLETFGELHSTKPLVIKNYSGTFACIGSASDEININTIRLYQSSPSELTLEGIYEVRRSVPTYTMQFEVLQVEPFIDLYPPNPEQGFGSSDRGSYQHRNIQKYVKIK